MRKLIIGSVLVLCVMAFLSLLLSCTSLDAPDKDDYTNDACYNHAYCLFINQDNHDKSACSGLEVECCDAEKEKRIYNRIEYCDSDKSPESWSFEKCMLITNQK